MVAEVGLVVDITIIPGPQWFPVMLHRLRSGVLRVFSCVTSDRSQEKRGRNVTGTGYMYKYHFYSLAVKPAFIATLIEWLTFS